MYIVNSIYKLFSMTLIAGVCFLSLPSCKKDKKEDDSTSTTTTATGTRSQLSADSMFLYAKEVYLWNESLPTSDVFNPRQYVNSDEEAGLNSELFAITRYAKNTSGVSYEYNADYPDETKYSYIFNTDDANPVAYVPQAKSSVDLEGNGYDFGFYVGLYGTAAAYEVRILAVYKGSPAYAAGLKRGDVITSINGTQVTSNYTSATEDFINSTLFDVSSVTLKVLKTTGTSSNITLTRVAYKSNPVYCDTVYTEGSKKVGYIAFARFSSLTNAQSVLDAAFSEFATAGITDLIVDLRYNGGGYVSTAEYLANLIAPSGKTGQIMYKEYFNSLLQSGKATILKNQPALDENNNLQYSNGRLITYADEDYSVAGNTYKFSKKGSLNNVQKVVFLVTGNTASASELVINSLKPYVDVKLVGEQSYGKPVGFFPITIDKYEVYYSMFQSKNANDEGDYFDGMTPDKEIDDNNKSDFGDLTEALTASAYNYLINGSFTSSTAKTSSVSNVSASKMKKMGAFKPARAEFKGMIESRKNFKR